MWEKLRLNQWICLFFLWWAERNLHRFILHLLSVKQRDMINKCVISLLDVSSVSLMEAQVDLVPEFTLLSALQMIYKTAANSNTTHQMSLPLGEICSQMGGGQSSSSLAPWKSSLTWLLRDNHHSRNSPGIWMRPDLPESKFTSDYRFPVGSKKQICFP